MCIRMLWIMVSTSFIPLLCYLILRSYNENEMFLAILVLKYPEVFLKAINF